MTPTEDQARALDRISAWWRDPFTQPQDFVLAGLAGTGKTAMIPWIVDMLGVTPRFVCPTWKAAEVLSGRLGGGARATSVHNLLYQPGGVKHAEGCPAAWDDDAECDGCSDIWWSKHGGADGRHQLIIVDEASMVPGFMYQDLLATGARILFVGDHGQLPPVRSGFSLFDPVSRGADVRLERIMRQGPGSSIIELAHEIRSGSREWVRRPEVKKVAGGVRHPLTREIVDDPESVVIAWRNKAVDSYNSKLRGLRGRGDVLEPGERVMAQDNAKTWGVFNGQTGVVQEDGSVLMETGVRYRGPWELKTLEQVRSEGRGDEGLVRFCYSYAITCHKAQGSEWDRVLVRVEGGEKSRMGDDVYRRWLYTAVTRASREVTVVVGR